MEKLKLKPDTDTFLTKIESLRFEIGDALLNLDIPTEPAYLYTAVKYALKGGGKRLRAILVHLVGELFGANKVDMINGGLAVELLHNFTLIHDDIMDEDYIRHGKDTIHKKWDESTAILSGDGIYVISQLLISKIKNNTLSAIKVFNKASLVVCEGQAYDKSYENNSEITLDDYFLMIEKKTAWMIGLCSELGGIISNQDDKTNDHLRLFGLNLGRAFQIQDDILEVYGDVKTVGKSLGSDLVAGKQTILTVLAREENNADWMVVWEEIKTMETQEAILTLRNYLNQKSVLDQANKYVKIFLGKAKNKLDIFPEKQRNEIKQFTTLILNRIK